MSKIHLRIGAIVLGFAALAVPNVSFGSEGGIGRSIPGTTVTTYVALIPPVPGFAPSISEIFYTGSFRGSRQLPVAGQLRTNVDADVSFTMLGGNYIWKPTTPKSDMASGILVPLAWVRGSAAITAGNASVNKTDTVFDLGDVMLLPIAFSWHLSPTEHVGLQLPVWAPTGSYQAGRLANPGLNYWTFSPNLAYSRFNPKTGIAFDAVAGFDVNTENPATNYTSGTMFRLDTQVIQRTPSGFGYGLIFSWFEQISNDSGSVASKLDGFRGHALAIGPTFLHKFKMGKSEVEGVFRWVHEFDTQNRIRGDVIQFNVGLKL